MKTLYTAIFIVSTILITGTKSQNNCSFIDTVDTFDITKLPGEWFTIMRWENGVEDGTKCIRTVIPDDLTKTRYLTFSDGEVETFKGAFDVKKSCQSTIFINWPESAGFPPKEYIIYVDDDYSIVIAQGCYENTGKYFKFFSFIFFNYLKTF